MNERGGSLVELCTVVAIIGVVVGVSVPAWSALVAKHQQRAVMVEMASELRMARQLAMARHERIRVVIDAEQSEFRTECMACDPRLLRRYGFSQKGTVIESMTTKPEILFHPSGRSATATTMVLVDGRHEIHQITVGITGRVTLS